MIVTDRGRTGKSKKNQREPTASFVGDGSSRQSDLLNGKTPR